MKLGTYNGVRVPRRTGPLHARRYEPAVASRRPALSKARATRPCLTGGGSPLPGEVVADVGVAVGGIIPQAPVKWKRLIKLVDLGTGIVDGRRNVRARRLLGQRQRWWAEKRGVVGPAAAARPDAGAFGALGCLLLLLLLRLPAPGACRAAHALHDDRRSIAVRGGRRRCTLGAMFLGARRGGCSRPKDKDGAGDGHYSG